MNEVNGKIAILAPYKELFKIAETCIKEYNNEIYIHEVNSRNVINIAKRYKEKGVEVIISRGGIAKKIREELGINVINIEISGNEILNSLYKYKDKNFNIAVVENETFIAGIKKINEIIKLNIQYYKISKIEEFHMRIKESIENGADLLIGGSWGEEDSEYIESKGISYELIKTQEISLKDAIEESIKLYKMTIEERKKKELLKTILNFSMCGIIAIDNKKNILTINSTAEKIIGVREVEFVGKNINSFFQGIDISDIIENKETKTGIIEKLNGVKVIMNKAPMVIEGQILGAVMTFQEIGDVQKSEEKIRYKLAKKGLSAKYTFENIKGTSQNIQDIIKLAKLYSKTDSTVLIIGESGTGKEVFAQAIHNESNRKDKAFVAINCSALPSNLLESELFGYVEGAFTGAIKGGKAGLFEIAHNGTIFLDEIGEIDKNMQLRLLRVIQEREVMRIGDDKILPINIRIIAATNKDLLKEVREGRFREDLYYRLNVLDLYIPPLRERKEDIISIAESILLRTNRKLGTSISCIDKEVLTKLEKYKWPGNIRELTNIIEKMVVVVGQGKVNVHDVNFILNSVKIAEDDASLKGANAINDNMTLKEIEDIVILRYLKLEHFNKTKTAERLGINRVTLNRKLKEVD